MDKIKYNSPEYAAYLTKSLISARALNSALLTVVLDLYKETSAVDEKTLHQRLQKLAEEQTHRYYEEIVALFGELPPDILEALNQKP